MNLPNSVTKLVLGYKYNQPLDYLPLSLRILVLGREFNQPLNNLPNTIKSLYVRYEYTGKPELLPESVEELTIRYHKPIYKLPANLKKIRFFNRDYKYNKELLMLKPDLIIES